MRYSPYAPPPPPQRAYGHTARHPWAGHSAQRVEPRWVASRRQIRATSVPAPAPAPVPYPLQRHRHQPSQKRSSPRRVLLAHEQLSGRMDDAPFTPGSDSDVGSPLPRRLALTGRKPERAAQYAAAAAVGAGTTTLADSPAVAAALRASQRLAHSFGLAVRPARP
jgi:hypothetical protein